MPRQSKAIIPTLRRSLLMAIVASVLVACSPGLPDGAKAALGNHVAGAEGPQFRYSIVSAQKASFSPADLAAAEIWCVVIDQQVTAPWLWTSITSNRFLVFKDGDVWGAVPAEALWGLELDEFPQGPSGIGCDNLVSRGD